MGCCAQYGFLDYTTPGAGGMEHYERDDYISLLDDMAAAGMNSLVMVIKWRTTGYTSRLPWLDQEPTNPAVAWDNGLVHFAIREAQERGIKVWLGAVVTQHIIEKYGASIHRQYEIFVDGQPRRAAIYDLDMPQVAERAVAIFDEIVELFPQADGLMVEVEGGDRLAPHRVEPYDTWAVEHGKRVADEGVCPDWFKYAAYRAASRSCARSKRRCMPEATKETWRRYVRSTTGSTTRGRSSI